MAGTGGELYKERPSSTELSPSLPLDLRLLRAEPDEVRRDGAVGQVSSFSLGLIVTS